MKQKWILRMLTVALLAGLVLTSCQMLNPRQKFATGLVNLILMPLEKLEEEEYTKDLSGEVQELVNTASHTMQMTIELDDIDMGDAFYYMDTSMLKGAEIDIETQYDAESGDFLMDVNGLGLVNGNLYLQENVMAVDVMGTMIAYEMESMLNFSKHIDLGDRIQDFQYALNPELAEMDTEMLDEARFLLEQYAVLLAENLEMSQIKLSTEKVEVLGKTKNCAIVTVSLDQDELRDLVEIMLEEAQDDDRLMDFVVNNFLMASTYYEDAGDAEDAFEEAIEYALDDIDYFLEDEEIDFTFSLYFQPKFLLSKDEAPVAMALTADDGDVEVAAFYKFIYEGREVDFAFTGEADGEEVSFYLTNLKDRNGYVMEGLFEMPYPGVDVEISGTTDIGRSTETSEMEILFTSSEGISGVLLVNSELVQIKKNSAYEMNMMIEGSINYEGEKISATAIMQGEYEFGKSMSVDIPDLDDDDFIRVDSLEELEEVIYDYGY